MTAKEMNGKIIDVLYDEGADMADSIVEEAMRFPDQDDTARKINISMPQWMIEELDATARHYAVSRQAVINIWIGERLATERKAASTQS